MRKLLTDKILLSISFIIYYIYLTIIFDIEELIYLVKIRIIGYYRYQDSYKDVMYYKRKPHIAILMNYFEQYEIKLRARNP